MRNSNERGMAMLITLLVLMLMSALLVGFTTLVMSDQRYRFIDRDRGQSFYAATGGIEKLTSDLGNLFFSFIAPTSTQVTLLTSTEYRAAIPGITYTSGNAPAGLPASQLSSYHCAASGKTVKTVGTNGYTIMYCANAAGHPTVSDDATTIKTGPYEGLIAQQIPYQLDVTAKSTTGGEVHLIRTVEGVAIPVFQFGMFSDVDLAFGAADDFTFGGRVHTNGNLYLSSASGSTLTMTDKITAVKQVVRQRLSNGVSIDTVGHTTGIIRIASSATTWRNLLRTEGSVSDGPVVPPSTLNASWYSISTSGYNYWLRNSLTGAKALNLPLLTVGGSNPDLVKRPLVDELTTNSVLFNERLFSKASLRILLSDNATDITNLQTVTAGTVLLDGDWNTALPAGYGPVALARPPVALSPGTLSTTISGTASTVATNNVASTVPFRPAISVLGTSITCTGKTAGTFTGCTPVPPAINIPPIPAPGATVSGLTGVSTTTTGIHVGGPGPMTLNVASTANFVPQAFWVNGAQSSCLSWTAAAFTGCAGLPAAPTTAGTLVTNHVVSTAGTGLLGGYIKIERGNTDGSFTDVTMEILNYGIGGPNIDGQTCSEPTPNAVVRLQRLRDNGGGTPTTNGGGCNYQTDTTGAKDPMNWWPNVLFDAREAVQRDTNYPGASNLTLGGTMYYVAIDAGNLAKWFKGTVAPFTTGTGASARTDNGGYTVYFSDRRNNRDAASAATGEYGWEDFVNAGVANGVPNGGSAETGEDLNTNSTLDLYGGFPNYNGTYNSVPPCAACPIAAGNPLTTAARPTTTLIRGQAQVNRAILFRRALKLTNGAAIAPTITGLTVVSENPVYIQGNWNATSTTFGVNDTHAATAVIADAVTVLSSSWTDNNSLEFPYAAASRVRANDSYYRVAIISGKGMIFPKPSDVATGSTFGTDGGAHSFLRMLEGGSSKTVHYRGSMATFFYNRQAAGPFKCCGGIVYSVPTRDFYFDTDFLDPAKLPPNTPVFRDMNAVGFSQELRPGR